MTDSRTARLAELDTEISRTEANVGKHTRKGQAARARLVELKRERHALNLPAEPPVEVDVVRFTKTFSGGRSFEYAAIAYHLHGPKCPHKRWSLTGKKDLTSIGWGTLAEFIASEEQEVPKVTWLAPSLTQGLVEFAAAQSGKPYRYGGR